MGNFGDISRIWGIDMERGWSLFLHPPSPIVWNIKPNIANNLKYRENRSEKAWISGEIWPVFHWALRKELQRRVPRRGRRPAACNPIFLFSLYGVVSSFIYYHLPKRLFSYLYFWRRSAWGGGHWKVGTQNRKTVQQWFDNFALYLVLILNFLTCIEQ